MSEAIIDEYSLILHSIIGRGTKVGRWARVEGTPSDPDPNKAFAKMENPPLFNNDGRLNPSITILGINLYLLKNLHYKVVYYRVFCKCTFRNYYFKLYSIAK